MSELNLNPRQQNHLEICCILIPTNIRLMSLLPEPQGETWVVPRSSWGPSSQSGQQGPPRTLQHFQGSSGVDFCFKFLKNRSEIWFTCHCRDISVMTRSRLLPSVHPQGKNHKRLDWQDITKIRNFKSQHLQVICRWLGRLENQEDHWEDYRPDNSVCI